MKYIISVREQNLETTVDPRFGRAQFFALFDSSNGTCTWHSNAQNLQAAQGAGIQSAQNVINLGAEAVITGHCGPKAYRVLNAAGIKIYNVAAQLSIKEAVKEIESGNIKPSDGADVEGHWV